MDTGYSSLRNLLFVVIALVGVGIFSNFYVASQLSRNSEELANMRLVLQKQLMGTALTQAEELQKRMDALNQSASGMDAKLKQAQDDFVARMQAELPRIMDNYIKQRSSQIEKQILQRGLSLPKP